MKITDVEVVYLKIPTVAMEANGTQDAAVVLVHTDDGITGVGEAESSPLVVKAIVEAPRSHSVMVGLRELLIGQDPFAIERLWWRMYEGSLYFGRKGAVLHAISGVDIALWDLKGKALGRPLCDLLGGSTATKVRAYASGLFGKRPEESGEKAVRFREAGFTAFKFGWEDFGRDPRSDRAHVEAIRRATGDEAPLMVDVGWARDSGGAVWDVKTALARSRMLAEYGVYWLEEPLHPDDLDGYRRLSAASPVRIAAGEEEAGLPSFRDLIERGGVDVVQPDVARAGGVTETMRIAAFADAHHRPCVPHHYSTGILGAVSVHVNASIPNRLFQETPAPGEGSVLNTDLVAPAFKLDADGCVVIPDGPGLGIDLDPDVMARFRVG